MDLSLGLARVGHRRGAPVASENKGPTVQKILQLRGNYKPRRARGRAGADRSSCARRLLRRDCRILRRKLGMEISYTDAGTGIVCVEITGGRPLGLVSVSVL
jgi:hypothetical protein